MATYKAALYIRLSYTDDKSSESDSVSNQRKLLTTYVQSHPDISVVCEKVDDGYSGIIFERPAFKEMMAQVELGEINCVIVKDLSRLGREYIETGRYLRQIFPAYGVRFIAINDRIDTLTDNSDDLVISVKSVMNDAYCRDISIKTRTALNVKRENGQYVGACPVYGYQKHPEDRNLLVPSSDTAQIVKDIFHYKLSGMSQSAIADTLNQLGVLSPMAYKKAHGLPHPTGNVSDKEDCKWTPQTILRILMDETYAGTLLQGRQGTHNYKIKDVVQKPKEQWKCTPNSHEAIINPYDFYLIQRILRMDTRTGPESETVPVFSGLLICGCCGERMTRKTSHYKDKTYYYYYCRTTKKGGCAKSVMIKEADLMECVLQTIKSYVANIMSVDAVLATDNYKKALRAIITQHIGQIATNENQLERVKIFKSSLYENYIGGLISKENYTEMKAKYIDDELRLTSANQILRMKIKEAQEGRSERLYIFEHMQRFQDLEHLDRKIAVSLIQHIQVNSKTELKITFRYQDEFEETLQLLQEADKLTREVA